MSNNKILNELKGTFQKYGISIAYLCGSQKENGLLYLEGKRISIEKGSDLDIGVVFFRKPEDVYHVYGSLYVDLSNALRPFSVDIVFMHEVSFIFRFEIINGYRIYAINEDDADNYEEIVVKFAEDLSYKRKMFEPDFYEALRDGYFEIKPK